MSNFLSRKFKLKNVMAFIYIYIYIYIYIVNVTASFALSDSQRLLYINKDNVKTKVNIVNTSKNDSNVTLNVIGNNKKSIKEELVIDKLSKKEISVDLLKDISSINQKNEKIESGVIDIKSDNNDTLFSVTYSFKNDNGKVKSIVNYDKDDITNTKSYFVVNKFIYPKLKNVKIYLYNVDDSEFEGTLERYQTIGKFKSKEEILKIKKGEEKVFDFKKAAQGTFVINPKNKTKYIAFLKLEYKNGKFEIVKPSDTFKKTSLLKSEGVLTLVNTSDDYMLLGYEVYDKGVLHFKGEFAFIPKAQKFIDLGEQTSHLESPVIRLLSSNINKSNKFKDSLIAAQINTKIKRKNLSYNFKNIKGKVGTKLTLGYNIKEDKNGYLNLYNEEDEDAKVKIVTDNNKNALELEVKANDILQVPLNEVLKGSNNYNNKETGIINVESTNQKNISVKLESLKQGEKEGLINVLRAKNIRALLNSNTDDFLVDAPNEPFEGTSSTTQSINKKLNFKDASTSSDVKELQDKGLGFGEKQIKKIQEATNRFAEGKGSSRDDGEDLIRNLRCTPRERVIKNNNSYQCEKCHSHAHRAINDATKCECDARYLPRILITRDPNTIEDKDIIQKICEIDENDGDGLETDCNEHSIYRTQTGLCECRNYACFDIKESMNINGKCRKPDYERGEYIKVITVPNSDVTRRICEKCDINEGWKVNRAGTGCECDRSAGYYLKDGQCHQCGEGEIVNAKGNGCECDRSKGYYGSAGSCSECHKNASINGKGDGCKCNSGYCWTGWDNMECLDYKTRTDIIYNDDDKRSCGFCGVKMIANSTHTACVCKSGYCYDQETKKCLDFKSNDKIYYINDSKGSCGTCGENMVSNAQNNGCECIQGTKKDGDRCLKCKNGGYYNESLGKCVQCEGYYNEGLKKCIPCKDLNMQWDYENKQCICVDGFIRNDRCISCGEHGRPSSDKTTCICNEGYKNGIDGCEKIECDDGFIKGNSCIKCTDGTPNDSKNGCICDKGYGWNNSKNECVKCGKDEVGDNNQCTRCGEKEFVVNNMCIKCTNQVVNKYSEKPSCLCDSGYGWNEESMRCDKCANNERSVNNKCTQCGNNEFVVNNRCKKCENGDVNDNKDGCKCNEGYGWDGENKFCYKCLGNTYSNNNLCEDCPQGMKPDFSDKEPLHKKCICEYGTESDGKGGCKACDLNKNEYYDKDSKSCKVCKENNKVSNGSSCDECPKAISCIQIEESGRKVCKRCDQVCSDGLVWKEISNPDERSGYSNDISNGKCCKSNEVACFTKNVYWGKGYTYICCPNGTTYCSFTKRYNSKSGQNDITEWCEGKAVKDWNVSGDDK